MAEENEKQGPGRPRDLEKRAAILDAARALFFTHGVEAVAIEAVAATAEVSKVTIYNQFGDKTGLFEAVVRREADRIIAVFNGLELDGSSLAERLNAWGVCLMQFILEKSLCAFDRLLSTEAYRHPCLARRFFDAGPARMRELLANVLVEASAREEIVLEDPQQAAEDLLMLWQGFLPMEARLGVRIITQQDIETRVRRGTGLFLKAVTHHSA